jgi:hypothetical protein
MSGHNNIGFGGLSRSGPARFPLEAFLFTCVFGLIRRENKCRFAASGVCLSP